MAEKRRFTTQMIARICNLTKFGQDWTKNKKIRC